MSVTVRRIREGERWSHLLCESCGNHLPRSKATQIIDAATGPVEIHLRVCCGDEDCTGYGCELSRAVLDPFASDYFETRILPRHTQP